VVTRRTQAGSKRLQITVYGGAAGLRDYLRMDLIPTLEGIYRDDLFLHEPDIWVIETINPARILPVHSQKLGWYESRWPERLVRAAYGETVTI